MTAMNKHLPTFLQHPLAREITLAIVIKLAVIMGLFFAFFDGRAVPTNADVIAERLAGHQQTTPHSPGNAHAD
jgi:hypothetical protein